MSTSLPRAALAASLGLLLAASLATNAVAAGGKPAPAPAKPAAKPAASDKFASLSELEAAADKAEADARKELRKARYAKVVAYLAANGSAKDAEEALGTAMDLAEEVEDWAKAVQHADEYLAAHAAGARKLDAMSTKASSLGHIDGKKDEAKKAFDAAMKAVDVDKTDPRAVLAIYQACATWQVDANDVDGAKATWQALKDFYAESKYAGEISKYAENQTAPLETVGKEAIAFPDTAKDLDGKSVTVGDFKGKLLLIDFWATWCPPCRAEMPNVIAAYKKFHDKGFEIVGITLDHPGDGQKVKDFIKDKGMPWRQVYYEEGHNAVAEAYGVDSIPHTVLVGKDGKVIRVGLRGEDLQKRLEAMFK